MSSSGNLKLCLSVAALSGAIAGPAAAQDVSALLLQKTQAFSDAGQQGDAAVMDKILDPDVVFINETGEKATKQDMVSSAAPPPKGVSVKMTVTDWRCQVFGEVAVASFIDDQAVSGRPAHTRFRSVETWRKQGGDWRMIGSETLTVLDDPASVSLAANVLDDYVGDYQGAGAKFTFTRDGEALMASVNGQPASEQKAEARDVFFTPGRGGQRKLFQRDGSGKITGFIYLRPGGDLVFNRVSSTRQPAAS
jgi:hypothetical protein